MTNKYPIKVLLDKDRNPFFPLVTLDAVLENNSERTLVQVLTDDYYNKTQVDKKIADLGTIQRLCGRVDSVADLPADAQVGDTYIVGPAGENNSEYIKLPDEWEELGPNVDLSGYYNKEDINKLFANIWVTPKTISAVWAFTVLPRSSVTPVAQDELTNKLYVDNSITTVLGNINDVLATLTTVEG